MEKSCLLSWIDIKLLKCIIEKSSVIYNLIEKYHGKIKSNCSICLNFQFKNICHLQITNFWLPSERKNKTEKSYCEALKSKEANSNLQQPKIVTYFFMVFFITIIKMTFLSQHTLDKLFLRNNLVLRCKRNSSLWHMYFTQKSLWIISPYF